MNMNLDTNYLLDVLTRLIQTPSPVGDTEAGIELCRELFCEYDFLQVRLTKKGALVATWNGAQDSAPRGVTAHIDTLGALVKEIKSNGRLRLSPLGQYAWTEIENEGVTIRTHSGASFRGTVLVENASHHLYVESDGPGQKPRDERTMEVRLDARTQSRDETIQLGIEVGDFIYLDTRLEINDNFIRARHLDDKACIAALLASIKAMHETGVVPHQSATFLIANYEEVGHGGSSGFPPVLAEVLALDIAPLGEGQNSDEYSCSLCVQDADGPYDAVMRRKLRRLAAQQNIALRPDIYPNYCSDGDALWKAGADVRAALIGPGVDATHGYERTHLDALLATSQLIIAYLRDEE